MDTHSKLTLEGGSEKHQEVPSVCPLQVISIRNSTIFSRLICQKDLNWPLENVHIEKFKNNTIHAKDSSDYKKIQLDYRRGSGKDFPPVWLRMSSESQNCKIEPPTGTGVCLDNVQFNSDSDHYNLHQFNSIVELTRLHLEFYASMVASPDWRNNLLEWECRGNFIGVFDDGADGWAYDLS